MAKDLDRNKGYYYDYKRGKYRVQFTYKGKRYRLGRYDNRELAHDMYLTEKAKIKKMEKQK